jgi:hypothetical protein
MPALTLNGYTIPIVSCPREEREFGYRGNAFSGRAIMQRNAIKSVWNCRTKPLAYSDYESVLRMIRGDGLVWGFDGALPTAYYSSSGFGPTTVYGSPYSAKGTSADIETPGLPRIEDSLQVSPADTANTNTRGQRNATKFADALWFGPGTTNLHNGATMELVNGATAAAPSLSGEVWTFGRLAGGATGSWRTALASAIDLTPFSVGTQLVFSADVMTSVGGVAGAIFLSTLNNVNASVNSLQITLPSSTTQWQRVVFAITRGTSAEVKLQWSMSDTTNTVHSIKMRRMQIEAVRRNTAFAAFGTPRVGNSGLKYDLSRWASAFPSTGFTALCWTPHPDLNLAADAGLFCMGTTGIDGGAAGEHRIGVEYAAGVAQVKMTARGASVTASEARLGTTWKLAGLMYRPSVPATPWTLINGGAVAAQLSPAGANNLDPAQLVSLFVSGVGISGGAVVNPAWCPIDEMMFFPYEISTDFLAFLNARTSGFGVAFPKAVLSGDVVNGKQIVVLGQVKGDDNTQLTLAGSWQNNAKAIDFTLTEV